MVAFFLQFFVDVDCEEEGVVDINYLLSVSSEPC